MYGIICWRKAPLWNQSSPIQPSTIGFIGTDTLSAGCGFDERHQRQEAVVGDPEDADAAVALRHVLHQPVDGVVGVGRVIDRRRVLRPAQRAVHHVVALGAVLPAHVLDHADVAALDDHVGGVVVAAQDRPEVGALGVARERARVVGRARQQDRRAPSRPSARGSRCAASRRRASGSSRRAGRSRSCRSTGLNVAGVSLGRAGYWTAGGEAVCARSGAASRKPPRSNRATARARIQSTGCMGIPRERDSMLPALGASRDGL